MVTTSSIARTFKTTMVVLIPAEMRAPASSSAVHASVTSAAGRSTMAPVLKVSCKPSTSNGGWESWAGRVNPKLWSADCAYPDQAMATMDTDIMYSSTRHHPTSQAIPSPSVA